MQRRLNVIQRQKQLEQLESITERELRARIRSMRLPYLRFSATADCNANCGFCHNEKQKMGNRGLETEPKLSYLPKEKIEYIADFFAPQFNEIKFTGGEPTITENLPEIVELFAKRGYGCSMTSNGFALNRDLQIRLKEAGLRRINISLPSLDPVKHAEYFDVPRPILDDVVRNLESLAETYKGKVKINFMGFEGGNIPSQLIPITELSGKLGIVISSLELIKSRTQHDPISPKIIHYLTENLGLHAVEKFPDNFFEKKIYTFSNEGKWEVDDFRRELYRDDAFNNDYCRDCGVKDKCIEGPYALRVSNDGTIRPCLIRNDNIICLDESGYRLRREQEKKTESNFLYAPV